MPEELVRLLALDSFGTLFDVKGGLAQALETQAVSDPARIAASWVQQIQKLTQEVNQQDQFRPFPQVVSDGLDAVLGEAGISLPGAAREQLLSAWRSLPLFPDVKPALERWRDLGAPPAWIITNGDLDTIQALLDHHHLSGLIQGVVTAGAVERYKPDPDIYQQASSSAGALPGQIVMVSALPHDVSGARTAGCRAGWLQREDTAYQEATPPNWTAADLDKMIDLLQPLLPRPEPGQQVY